MRDIAITKIQGQLVLFYMEEGKLYDVLVGAPETAVEVGDIYLGKVQNIVKNINAAFVEVKPGSLVFLPLSEEGMASRVKHQEELVVQVKKAAVKSKQPVASRFLEIAGGLCVITTKKSSKTISKKIEDKRERVRLEKILEDYQKEKYGIIFRTNARGASEEAIRAECDSLLAELHGITEKSQYRTCFSLLRKEPAFYLRYIRDAAFDRVVTDEEEVYDTLLLENVPHVLYYQDTCCNLDCLLGLSAKLKKVMEKHVWLKSGGSLVIEPTEALTVIDVNTEKAIQGKRNQESTFFRINCEAAVEAARQIRVRNISGIILIDFIDMKEKEKTQELLELLRSELMREKTFATVVDITKLGLVELTRMKKNRPLWEALDLKKVDYF